MAVTTKARAQLFTGGPSIDANYGPWTSLDEYMAFIKEAGLEEPYSGTTIAIVGSSTGKISKYVYENGSWRSEVSGTGGGGGTAGEDCVLKTPQPLTSTEQAQVRQNIGATSEAEVDNKIQEHTDIVMDEINQKIDNTIGNINALLETL